MQAGLFVVGIVLALTLGIAAQSGPTAYIPAVQFGGFDVIFSNDTSFLDEIDFHNDVIYVAGQGVIREVVEAPFSLAATSRYFAQQHRFIDFRAFMDINNQTWAVGPITAHHINSDKGYIHPIQAASVLTNDSQSIGTAASEMPSSIHLHITPASVTLAYLVGWQRDTTDNSADLVVVRATVDTTKVGTGGFLIPEAPVVLNSSTGYDDYYRTFKPKIFRSNSSYLLVLDPSSRIVYKLSTGNDDGPTPTRLNVTSSLFINTSGSVGGSTFDNSNDKLYVGMSVLGAGSGSIVVINTLTMAVDSVIALDRWQANPTALSYRDGKLYVGLYGGLSIVQLDLTNTNQLTKYATVPWYLRNVQSVTAGRDGYVYFVTYDQFAKVARADLRHFCFSVCDFFFGYCEDSECKCVNGTTLSDDGRTCNVAIAHVDDDTPHSHAGEVALGLLFAVTLIAAVIGWFLLWRTKKGGGGGSGGTNGRYTLANEGEHDKFLGDEDN